jgi:hypothetical protein
LDRPPYAVLKKDRKKTRNNCHVGNPAVASARSDEKKINHYGLHNISGLNRANKAGPESDKVLGADGNRRYSTVAFAVAEIFRDGEVKQRTTFKIDQMTVMEWIGINMKAFPLPFYASFGLMGATPLGTRCRACGKIHGREVCAFQGINGKPGDSLARCDYAFCDDKGKHARKVCPTLNHRCSSCLYRGHRAKSKRCGQFDANLPTFEYQAGHGSVTANRTRDWGQQTDFDQLSA